MVHDPVFNCLREYLEQHDGICIGECHDDTEAPYFLARYMKDFAKVGVTVLFVECIDRLDQDMLDHFQNTGELEKIFPPMRTHFSRALDWELNRWAKPGKEELKKAYIDMLNAARECDIRIIGIDDYDLQGDKRLELSNPVWIKTIQDNMPKSGKFIAHGGYFHFSRLCIPERHVEPVSEKLGVPSFHFSVNSDDDIRIKENTDDCAEANVTIFLPKGAYCPVDVRNDSGCANNLSLDRSFIPS